VLLNSTVPLSGCHFTTPEIVCSETLPSTFMPRTLIAVAIGKVVDSKAMDLISKILPGISITIPGKENRKGLIVELQV